jgi:hypothetical protein
VYPDIGFTSITDKFQNLFLSGEKCNSQWSSQERNTPFSGLGQAVFREEEIDASMQEGTPKWTDIPHRKTEMRNSTTIQLISDGPDIEELRTRFAMKSDDPWCLGQSS